MHFLNILNKKTNICLDNMHPERIYAYLQMLGVIVERPRNTNKLPDLEDCDKILRIDSEENIVSKTIELLNSQNFACEELQ